MCKQRRAGLLLLDTNIYKLQKLLRARGAHASYVCQVQVRVYRMHICTRICMYVYMHIRLARVEIDHRIDTSPTKRMLKLLAG